MKAWLLLFVILLAHPARADRFPGAQWEAVQEPWSTDGLGQAQDLSRRIGSTAVMIIHHGGVVAEWGDVEKRTELASVRKSFLSALIGIAVARHQIDLNATVAQLGIDDNPPALTDTEKQATVQMLLEARSGIYHPALYETAGMAAKRPVRGSHAPGTFWYYNNWDFNALGTIYEHATDTGIYDALEEQIAKPIGMQDYRPSDGTYFYGSGSIHRAYPIRMSARDLARFALLYLNNGNWAGRQVVPAAWVAESTKPYSDSGYGPGYGYLWWTGRADPPDASGAKLRAKLPKGSFFAWGAGGQFAFVIPADDLVIVHRIDRDQHIPDPRLSQIADLLRTILAAGGFED